MPVCPQCHSQHTYSDGDNYVCPECAYEWPMTAVDEGADGSEQGVRDSNGTILVDGDSVLLIKDLKVKGSSMILKGGTKVKGIRLREGDHEVDCKIGGTSFMLKARFLKKA